MAYTKQTWSCGDNVTDIKMNHIEQGIADAHECCDGGVRYIHAIGSGTCQSDEYTEMDISYQEIVDGLADGVAFWIANEFYSKLVVLYPHVVESVGGTTVYEVDAYVASYDAGQGSFYRNAIKFYCDTVDGNMRDRNCWGVQ